MSKVKASLTKDLDMKFVSKIIQIFLLWTAFNLSAIAGEELMTTTEYSSSSRVWCVLGPNAHLPCNNSGSVCYTDGRCTFRKAVGVVADNEKKLMELSSKEKK